MHVVEGPAGTSLSPAPTPQDVVRQAKEDTAYVGLVIFLGSWSVMFAALFFGYALYRVGAHSNTWPPPEVAMVPFWMPLLNTGVILASSIALERARRAMGRGDADGFRTLIIQTLGLALTFVALQAGLWTALTSEGVTLLSGQYATQLYLLTIFHAIHVIVGVGLLGWLRVRSAGPVQAAWSNRVRLIAMYWHFVGVAWLLMFLLLFVV